MTLDEYKNQKKPKLGLIVYLKAEEIFKGCFFSGVKDDGNSRFSISLDLGQIGNFSYCKHTESNNLRTNHGKRSCFYLSNSELAKAFYYKCMNDEMEHNEAIKCASNVIPGISSKELEEYLNAN